MKQRTQAEKTLQIF